MKEKKSRQLRKMVTKWWQNCDKKLTKKLFSQFVSQNEPIIEMISTEKINLEFTFEEFFNWAISYQGLWSRGCGELWQGIDKRTFASCSWRYLVPRKNKVLNFSPKKDPFWKHQRYRRRNSWFNKIKTANSFFLICLWISNLELSMSTEWLMLASLKLFWSKIEIYT